MSSLNRATVLNILIKHETLTIDDFTRMANLGIIPKDNHLLYLIDELIESGHIHMLDGVSPKTYTITKKGISEGARMSREG